MSLPVDAHMSGKNSSAALPKKFTLEIFTKTVAKLFRRKLLLWWKQVSDWDWVLSVQRIDSWNDIDECAQNSKICGDNKKCENTIGSYKCSCKAGFTEKNGECSDNDECLRNWHEMQDNCF